MEKISMPTLADLAYGLRQKRRQRGFTLIELMIVVVIVGILAAVALPNYNEYVRRGRRSDAMSALTSGAQALERYYTENMSYNVPVTPSTLRTALVPATSTGGFYTIAWSNVSATTWTLTATPVVGSAQANDKCGSFSLTNTGVKGVSASTVANCWK
ncbi:MAG: type IV pilin protein [Janthinobacterium lividum]